MKKVKSCGQWVICELNKKESKETENNFAVIADFYEGEFTIRNAEMLFETYDECVKWVMEMNDDVIDKLARCIEMLHSIDDLNFKQETKIAKIETELSRIRQELFI